MTNGIHASENHALDCPDRRSTIKTMALGGVALFAGAGIATPAGAECPEIACVQEGWRWCNKCQGMFYGLASASQGGLGVCPAGGTHATAGSGYYYQRVGTDIANVQQGGWSCCPKCMGFFYSRASVGAGGMGRCPAGAAHIKAGSPAYAAVVGGNATGQQGGWRWCNKCMGMFYSQSTTSACPAGGTHITTGSGQYATLT